MDVKSFQTVLFDEPVEANTVRFVISSGYSGTKYKDCCITEIELIGLTGEVLSDQTYREWGNSVATAVSKVQGGGRISKGDSGVAVLGLQVLLRDVFGVFYANADGSFGGDTASAVNQLADLMRAELGGSAAMMTNNVVDQAYWSNMAAYSQLLQGDEAAE